MSTTAREIMTSDVAHLTEEDSVVAAAEQMAELGVGSLPICTSDGHLVGMVTDRDIVTDVIAKGQDPAQVQVGRLAQGEAVTIGADDSLDEARRVMAEHQVRRLPVIDGHRLVGIISQKDIAMDSGDAQTGEMVERISE
jgi:CBS domain-containing protein